MYLLKQLICRHPAAPAAPSEPGLARRTPARPPSKRKPGAPQPLSRDARLVYLPLSARPSRRLTLPGARPSRRLTLDSVPFLGSAPRSLAYPSATIVSTALIASVRPRPQQRPGSSEG